MKPIFVLFALLLTGIACSLPGSSEQPKEQDQVATAVAATVESLPTATSLIEPTAIIDPTETSVSPTTPTPTLIPTLAPTSTPTEVQKEADGIKIGLVTDVGGIDTGFNKLAWQGLQKAEQDFNVQVKFLESTQQTNYERYINQFIEQDYDLIITVGFLMRDHTLVAAQANPDTAFAIVNVNDLTASNLLQSRYPIDEGSFLAGYLAAGVSEAGTVGTRGSGYGTVVEQYFTGFEQGVKYYNQVHGTDIKINSSDAVPDILLVIPTFGIEEIGEDVQNQGGLIIGVDSDWYNEYPAFAGIYLTSVVKRIDLFSYEATKAIVEGDFQGGILEFNLANGGIELAPYHEQAHRVSPELQAELDQLKADIISGKVSTGWDK